MKRVVRDSPFLVLYVGEPSHGLVVLAPNLPITEAITSEGELPVASFVLTLQTTLVEDLLLPRWAHTVAFVVVAGLGALLALAQGHGEEEMPL